MYFSRCFVYELCCWQRQTQELLKGPNSVQTNLAKQLVPTGIVVMRGMHLLRLSVPQETVTLVDGWPLSPTFSIDHLRTKLSQTLVWSRLCFLSLIFGLYFDSSLKSPSSPTLGIKAQSKRRTEVKHPLSLVFNQFY